MERFTPIPILCSKARKEKGGIFEDGNWSVVVFITVGLDDRLKHIKAKMELNCSIHTKR